MTVDVRPAAASSDRSVAVAHNRVLDIRIRVWRLFEVNFVNFEEPVWRIVWPLEGTPGRSRSYTGRGDVAGHSGELAVVAVGAGIQGGSQGFEASAGRRPGGCECHSPVRRRSGQEPVGRRRPP